MGVSLADPLSSATRNVSVSSSNRRESSSMSQSGSERPQSLASLISNAQSYSGCTTGSSVEPHFLANTRDRLTADVSSTGPAAREVGFYPAPASATIDPAAAYSTTIPSGSFMRDLLGPLTLEAERPEAPQLDETEDVPVIKAGADQRCHTPEQSGSVQELSVRTEYQSAMSQSARSSSVSRFEAFEWVCGRCTCPERVPAIRRALGVSAARIGLVLCEDEMDPN